MSDPLQRPVFDQSDLGSVLTSLDDAELDKLHFGAIGFDLDGVVRRYNRAESDAAGLSKERVVGQRLFTSVAP